MKKVDIIESGKTSKKNLANAFKCGECLHYKHKARFEDVCTNMGVRATGIAPNCFTPNVVEVASDESQMLQLASLWNNLSYKKRRILVGMLMSRPRGRKLLLGTKVFFHAVGADYLSNYLAGYVMGYSSNGELMVSGSPDKNSRGSAYVAFFGSDRSVMTSSEFRPVKAKLVDSKKIVDPESPLIKIKKSSITDYEPPTIDSAPASWHARASERNVDDTGKKSKKKGEKNGGLKTFLV